MDEVGPSKPDDLLYEAVRQRRIVRQSRSRGRRVAKRWVTECGGRGSGRELDVEWIQSTKQVDMPRVVEKGKFAKSRKSRGRGLGLGGHQSGFGHKEGASCGHEVVGSWRVIGGKGERLGLLANLPRCTGRRRSGKSSSARRRRLKRRRLALSRTRLYL